MARMRQNKGEDLIKAKKALFRKITIMKLVQVGQSLALIAIALKYTGLLDLILSKLM